MDVRTNLDVTAGMLCPSEVIMVLGRVTISIKDHSDLDVLVPHGLHKPEVALSNVPPGEVSLPFNIVQEPATIDHKACTWGLLHRFHIGLQELCQGSLVWLSHLLVLVKKRHWYWS